MNPDYQIDASSSERWAGWPPVNTSSGGLPARPVLSGQHTSIHFSKVPSRNLLVVVSLGEVPQQDPARALQILASGQNLKILRKADFPEILVCELNLGPDAALPLTITFRGAEKTAQKALAQIASVAIVDKDTGRFSPAWTSWIRAAQSLASGGKPLPWSIEDFPHSHFDGLAYLLEHHEARTGILSRKYSSAYQYFLKKGKSLGHKFPLAVGSTPLPGTPFNLVTHYREQNHTLTSKLCEFAQAKERSARLTSELAETKEENELLLLQLHQVQEELEQYFLQNRKLLDSQKKLAELEKTHQELLTRHSSRVTDLEKLQDQHSSLSNERTALQAKITELENTTNAATRERDAFHTKLAELEKTHQELLTRHSSLVTALEQLQGQHSSLATESTALQAKVTELEGTTGAATRERDALQAKLAELEKTHQDLLTRHAALVTSEKDLTAARDNAVKERDELNSRLTAIQAAEAKAAADLEAKLAALAGAHTAEREATQNENAQLKVKLAELEKNHQELLASVKDLTAARDNAVKERDQGRTERDNARKECDALKKTASDRATRIAELEAQVADQAERQKQIDEEMAKAEGQLEMLKELLSPALT